MDVITSDVYNCETLLSVLAEASRNGYGCRGIYGWAYDKERSCTLERIIGSLRGENVIHYAQDVKGKVWNGFMGGNVPCRNGNLNTQTTIRGTVSQET